MADAANNKENTTSDRPVQDRLLDAAEGLFCEQGFDGTSIRDIATVADCNIASVNYYFGGKEKLYEDIWHRHLKLMRDVRLASIDKVMSQSGGEPVLEDLLTSFANAFIEPLADEAKSGCLIKLMTREMLDRHLPANMFVDEIIKPTLAAMQKALTKTCPGLDGSKVPLVVFCFVGQLIHAIRVKAMFDEGDNTGLPIFNLADAVNHIVKFSAAGIRAFAEDKTQ
ncbi:MAG: CerR family C-terminal domain-containing protein [Planctomycetota bacterium]